MSAHPKPGRAVAAAALVTLLAASDAVAQVWIGSDAARRGSVEVSGAVTWSGGQSLPPRDATLTPNPGTGASSFVLFETESSLESALGGRAAVGVYVTRRLAVEGGIHYARPQLRTLLTNDFEGAPDVTATTPMTQYLFTGSILYHFGDSPRAVPFIAAGAGHLRDVHAANELVETGTEYHGLAGVKIWFGRGGRKLGLRAEGGVSVIEGGFSFEEGTRTVPTAAIGLSYLF